MTDTIAFGGLAAITVLAALLVVRSQNLIRATLWLGLMLVLTAGLYAMAGASFLAGVQVLLYVGGVVTLMIFGVMMTRRHEGLAVIAESRNQVRAGIVAAALFAVFAWAILSTEGLDGPKPVPVTSADLGRGLLGDHVLAFEAASLLLLGAIIGAAVIARRRDPGAERHGVKLPKRASASEAEAGE